MFCNVQFATIRFFYAIDNTVIVSVYLLEMFLHLTCPLFAFDFVYVGKRQVPKLLT